MKSTALVSLVGMLVPPVPPTTESFPPFGSGSKQKDCVASLRTLLSAGCITASNTWMVVVVPPTTRLASWVSDLPA